MEISARISGADRAVTAVAAIGLPLGWLAMRPIGGAAVPGFWWTTAHAVWFAGFIAMAGVGLLLGRALRGSVAGRVAAVVTVSALLNAAQVGLDVVAGVVAADATALKAGLPGLTDLPAVHVLVYGAGAQALHVGLAVAIVLLARRGAVPASAAAVLVVGELAVAASLVVGRNAPVVGAGMVLVGVGLVASTYRRTPADLHPLGV
jgi:hypothetical protein